MDKPSTERIKSLEFAFSCCCTTLEILEEQYEAAHYDELRYLAARLSRATDQYRKAWLDLRLAKTMLDMDEELCQAIAERRETEFNPPIGAPK